MNVEPTDSQLFCGVDVGASATKLVLLDRSGEVRSRVVRPSGIDYAATARACLESALDRAGMTETPVGYTLATGYGRGNVGFADDTLTEIHCHGLGCYHLVSRAMTIVDIGGQDNKVIRIGDDGRRLDFTLNRKCAAGTGAFLEEIALRLGIELEELEGLARATSDAVRLSSFCTVFAKTEILAHLRRGVPASEIVRGAFLSVVSRVVEMSPLAGYIVMSGGVVAHNPVIATILAEQLGTSVEVSPHPQFTAALGAALAAFRSHPGSAG
jgi:predicted CoA-substrate-specific enzyme activase